VVRVYLDNDIIPFAIAQLHYSPVLYCTLRLSDDCIDCSPRAGWYLGQDLGGFRSPKAYPTPGQSYQSTGYCVQGPSDWVPFYRQEPENNATGATPQQLADLLLGGEASAWGDCISAESFESMVWPTTSAVAERLWSAKSVNNVTEALPRLAAMRCSMVRRGIRVSPLHPGSCWGVREID
jgi:hypothetical protein